MRPGDTVNFRFTVTHEYGPMESDLEITVKDASYKETSYSYPGDHVSRVSAGVYLLTLTLPEDAPIGQWKIHCRANGEVVSGSSTIDFGVQEKWS